ncbi:MAG: cytochrome C biogenesis protein [Clostridium sp.]|uniref:cytochrome C biogenesis protein n=1 Tax=Clostridium sp. TaxID=1506 RepID=UPI0025C6C0FF|nr:cytochrome C biogenesis protein [Clostridium sp.]MCH3964371.1 cytochrome C biogenesis protein [Clostridium sp.]MCI1715546.1 cytochrome C biogenesis protein [Clostridium sp.]MCI1799662.1 cytochrome C biogenesis protein [Clostridium sp.]MCI1813730.1 cytochrome C biogenesis protein [Clostridium sp.]MCI1870475.1 cytochrome C biogenesis protein [Clostridium sp.]
MNSKNYKIETFIPEEYVDNLRESLNEIGALSIGGNYDNCMSVSKVTGYWRPLEGASPFEGEVGRISMEEECKVEFCCKSTVVKKAVETIKRVHPYEVPVINILSMADCD